MEFDFETLAAYDRYKILTSTIVPRPIAWVTTLSKNGVRNAAPFSFFNALSKEPPLLALGITADGDGSMKDTARNILDTHEYVINLVPRSAAQSMNLTSIDATSDVDELALAKLETRPSPTPSFSMLRSSTLIHLRCISSDAYTAVDGTRRAMMRFRCLGRNRMRSSRTANVFA